MPICSRGQDTRRNRETHYNRILRRADWRFLLPNPKPGKTVCRANGLLAEAVAAVCESACISKAPPGESDLVVLVNPDLKELESAWAALRDGGVCYSEWYSPFIGGAAGVRRRVESAGFTEVACYWPWAPPQIASPSFWLPLDAPRALNYFLSTRPRSTSFLPRIWNAMLRIIWRVGKRARVLVPICAVARKSTHTAAEYIGGDLSKAIRSRWESWGLGTAPKQLDLLLLTGGEDTRNKIAALVFADSEPTPRMVLKFARVPESIPGLEREAANLEMLRCLHPSGIAGVPRELFLEKLDGMPVLGETVMMGQPLYSLLRPGNFDELARKVSDWLAKLGGDAAIHPRAEWWDRLVGQVVCDFERCFGPVLDSTKLHETRHLLDRLGDIPLVCEQRDCSPWNVMIAGDGTVIVLDWESAEARGLPFLDLHYFLTHCAIFLADAMLSDRAREAYRSALDPTTPTGRVIIENEHEYFARLGLDPTLLHPLRLLTWLIHSRSEYKRLVAQFAGPPDSKALRCSRFVSLWEEELAHAIKSL